LYNPREKTREIFLVFLLTDPSRGPMLVMP
jgi:hypothetical protein